MPLPVNWSNCTINFLLVLGRTGVTGTGATVVNGDLGLSPALLPIGFPPGVINGAIRLGLSPAAAAAQVDLLAAIDAGAARTRHTLITGDLVGRTFHMGVHYQSTAMALTGTMTLDAEGDSNAVFIFQTDAAFNTSAGSSVVLEGGAQAANVFWVVNGAAGVGATTTLSGAILARGAITLGQGTELEGRALSRDAVTLHGSTITRPGFSAFARQASESQFGDELSVTTGEAPPGNSDESAPVVSGNGTSDISEATTSGAGTPPQTIPTETPTEAVESSAVTSPPDAASTTVPSINPTTEWSLTTGTTTTTTAGPAAG